MARICKKTIWIKHAPDSFKCLFKIWLPQVIESVTQHKYSLHFMRATAKF